MLLRRELWDGEMVGDPLRCFYDVLQPENLNHEIDGTKRADSATDAEAFHGVVDLANARRGSIAVVMHSGRQQCMFPFDPTLKSRARATSAIGTLWLTYRRSVTPI